MENLEVKSGAKIGGIFDVKCFRKGELIWEEKGHNLLTYEGLDATLNIMLHGATQITAWYCLLFEDDYTPLATNTYAVPGFTETTSYDEGTRPAYVEAESTARSTTNSASPAVFTISATKTMYGAALVGGGTDADTKADTAGGGTLFCLFSFALERAVLDNDVINLTYTITIADDGV